MLIVRISPISGKTTKMDLPIPNSDMLDWLSGGKLIQEAFPYLTPDGREFILTGITPEEWDAIFSDPEDDRMRLEDFD